MDYSYDFSYLGVIVHLHYLLFNGSGCSAALLSITAVKHNVVLQAGQLRPAIGTSK